MDNEGTTKSLQNDAWLSLKYGVGRFVASYVMNTIKDRTEANTMAIVSLRTTRVTKHDGIMS